MTIGSIEHWLILSLIFSIITTISLIIRRSTPETKGIYCLVLGYCCITAYICNLCSALIDTPKDIPWQYFLPCHFCTWLLLICLVSVWGQSRIIRSIAYFSTLTLSIQALLTPNLAISIYSLSGFAFCYSHGLELLIAFSLPICFSWKPKKYDFAWAILFINLYLMISFIINIILKTNYGYTLHPPNSTSLLNYLGHWPIYLLTGQALLIPIMFLLSLPFRQQPAGFVGFTIKSPKKSQ